MQTIFSLINYSSKTIQRQTIHSQTFWARTIHPLTINTQTVLPQCIHRNYHSQTIHKQVINHTLFLQQLFTHRLFIRKLFMDKLFTHRLLTHKLFIQSHSRTNYLPTDCSHTNYSSKAIHAQTIFPRTGNTQTIHGLRFPELIYLYYKTTIHWGIIRIIFCRWCIVHHLNVFNLT
jgi:hypothetical protein